MHITFRLSSSQIFDYLDYQKKSKNYDFFLFITQEV